MSTTLLRILFGAAVLVFVGQLGFRALSTEPYPGLFQPAFGVVPQDGDVAISGRIELVATYADKHVERLTVEEFLPATRTVPSAIVNAAFSDPLRAQDVRTVAWVRQRLVQRYPSPPTMLTVTWHRVERRVVDGRAVEVATHSVTVDLEDQT